MKRLTFTPTSLFARMRQPGGMAFLMVLFSIFTMQQDLNAQACPLACNDRVQVSLDDQCTALILPDDILEAPGISCNYSVRVYNRNGTVIPNNTVGYQHIGQTLQVSVFLGNNSCWGSIVVEDKLAPQLFCSDDLFVTCADTAFVVPLPEIDENCDPDPQIILLSDDVVDLNCDFQGYSARRVLTYRAVDRSGNYSNTCQQVVWYERRTLADVELPPNWDGIDTFQLTCDNIDPEWDLNGDFYPNPEETGVPTIDGFPIYPENRGFCEMNVTYEDQVLPICEKSFKILRKWTIVDWCSPVSNNTRPPNPYEFTQLIKVVDDRPPVVLCPPAFTVSTDVWTCTGSTFAPPPTVLYDCNDWDYEVFYKLADPFGQPSLAGAIKAQRYPNGLYFLPDLPLGRTWIIYRIADACGNITECASEVDVEDQVPPTPVCDEHTVVSLTADGTAKAYAETFDDGSIDNCEILRFDVRRMDRGTPCGKDVREFREYVEFCCEDIGNTIMVELRVWDRAENTNTCMVEVNVQDKLPPFLQCPPNITVSCEFDYADLNEFGRIVDSAQNREPIIINDPHVQFSGPALDGYVLDNCHADVDVRANENINCATGTIRRTFTATDVQGLRSSCTQVITLRDFNANNVTIIPPADYERDITCIDSKTTSPDTTGRPTILGDDKCSLIAINYEDQEFILQQDACFKILRTWTIIDWCKYEQGSTEPFPIGKYTYTQIIKLDNKVPPEFTGATCNNRAFDTFGPGCGGEIDLIGEAEDDCTDSADLVWKYYLDLFDDGKIDSIGTTNDASMFYPVGRHSIRWEVEDQCGNINQCESIIRVRDAKKPTPYCIHGISTVVMPSTENLEIWASDFNLNSEDNCTAKEDLRFFFEVNGIFTDSLTLDCSNLGENEIRVYVVDESGNSDYCTTYLILTDPNGVCSGTDPVIAGAIENESGQAVNGASVFLDRTSPPSQKILHTNADGEFFFRNLALNSGYAVYPRSNENPLNGVSTKDLVAIQRHLLGQAIFNSPYKIIAADVNNDSRVSAKDLVELRRLILGINNQFRNGQQSWRFVSEDFQFNDPQQPFPFAEQIVYDRLLGNQMNTDFIGVKIGDVTGDARVNANAPTQIRSNTAKLELQVDNILTVPGENHLIPVYASELSDLTGFQMAVMIDEAEWIGIRPGILDIQETMYTVQGSHIMVSFHQAESQLISPEEILFYLEVKAIAADNISNLVTIDQLVMTPEVYDDELNSRALVLGARTKFPTVVGFELYQNTPNPFADYTEISFELPETTQWSLSVFDVTGKVVKRVEGTNEKGTHIVRIEGEDLNTSGILYYQLDTETFTATRKMVRMK